MKRFIVSIAESFTLFFLLYYTHIFVIPLKSKKEVFRDLKSTPNTVNGNLNNLEMSSSLFKTLFLIIKIQGLNGRRVMVSSVIYSGFHVFTFLQF